MNNKELAALGQAQQDLHEQRQLNSLVLEQLNELHTKVARLEKALTRLEGKLRRSGWGP